MLEFFERYSLFHFLKLNFAQEKIALFMIASLTIYFFESSL